MKLFLAVAVLLSSATFVEAVQVPTPNQQVTHESDSTDDAMTCANRKGGHRVGGNNSKGKGSHYRGGRRR